MLNDNDRYTDEEIRAMWQASGSKGQVAIQRLAEMKLCDTRKICEIVGVDYGEIFAVVEPDSIPKPMKEPKQGGKKGDKREETSVSKRELNRQRTKNILTFLDAGMSVKEICDKLNVDRQCVYDTRASHKRAESQKNIETEQDAVSRDTPATTVTASFELASEREKVIVHDAFHRLSLIINAVYPNDGIEVKKAAMWLASELSAQAAARGLEVTQ
jgi:hypothetical protein